MIWKSISRQLPRRGTRLERRVSPVGEVMYTLQTAPISHVQRSLSLYPLLCPTLAIRRVARHHSIMPFHQTFQSLLAAALFSTLTFAAPPAACTQPFYKAISSAVATYAPAKSFCATAYPMPTPQCSQSTTTIVVQSVVGPQTTTTM